MIAVREVQTVTHEANVPTVDSVQEAQVLLSMVKGGKFTSKAEKDAANGLVEAFFVTHLRQVPKGGFTLENAISSLNATFPNSKVLSRAIGRVKAFRNKNRAFR